MAAMHAAGPAQFRPVMAGDRVLITGMNAVAADSVAAMLLS